MELLPADAINKASAETWGRLGYPITGPPTSSGELLVKYKRGKGSSRTRQTTRCPVGCRSGAYETGGPSRAPHPSNDATRSLVRDVAAYNRNARSPPPEETGFAPCHVSSSNGTRLPGMIRPSCYPRDVEAVSLGCPCPDDVPIGPASSKARWLLPCFHVLFVGLAHRHVEQPSICTLKLPCLSPVQRLASRTWASSLCWRIVTRTATDMQRCRIPPRSPHREWRSRRPADFLSGRNVRHRR